jgi:hypothetical protein
MNRLYDLLAPALGVSIALALLTVLLFLIYGGFRRYRLLYAYVSWELFATLGFTVADVLYHGTAPTSHARRTVAQLWYARLYWTNDVLVDLFRFVLVIVFIYMASEGVKRVSPRLLAALVILAMILPFVLFNMDSKRAEIDPLHFQFPSSHWLNSTSELLNFGAAILNLMLWGTLLSSRRRDPHILGVSIGLGIVVTGTAVAYGVRHLISATEFAAVGYLFMNLTQLAGWLVWCRTFRPQREVPRDVRPTIAVQD